MDLSNDIDSRIRNIIDRSLRSLDDSTRSQSNLLKAILEKDWLLENARQLAYRPPECTDMAEEEKYLHQIPKFLGQLQYPGMPDRHERIAEAHEETFDWIYQDPQLSSGSWSSFAKWLNSGVGPYFITGKAGSGKSTLMKYLYGDTRTRQALQLWAGQLPLVIAGFFFWSSGTEMQMSQMGLLQTLLHEALSQQPSLIPVVFPQRWQSYRASSVQHCSWTNSELIQAFKLLVKQSESVKFCFFIDGLDECCGDHGELTGLLTELVSSSDIRTCLSSRPWLLFEDAFGYSSNLMLQDLTYRGVKLYITAKLCENRRYLELEQNEPMFATDLVEDIATKASGVWLWVHLVVQSLLDGLTNSDKISDLQKRLRSTPADLEDLYEKMLDSIDLFYFEHASQLFQIVHMAQSPPSLLGLSFADEEDPLFALQADIKPLSDNEKLLRCQIMKSRLNSRCKGFLEVPLPNSGPEWAPSVVEFVDEQLGEELQWLAIQARQRSYKYSGYEQQDLGTTSLVNQKVEYLHRTVKDFIARPDIWSRMTAATKNSFDPNLALCQSYLLQLKTIQPRLISREGFWDLVTTYMYHTNIIKEFNITRQISLFYELDRAATILSGTPRFVASTVGRAFSVDSEAHWTSTGPRGKRGNTLSAFAIQYDFDQYVRAKVSEPGFELYDQDGRPLLLYATVDWESSSTAEARRIYDNDRVLQNIRIIRLLLERGADPNHGYASSTPWCDVLLKAREISISHFAQSLSRPRLLKRWANIIELLIRHGSDPRVKLSGSGTIEIIRETFSEWDPSRAEYLERMLRQSKRRWTLLGRLPIRYRTKSTPPKHTHV